MTAGEAGVDYVLFGEPDTDGVAPSLDAIVERVSLPEQRVARCTLATLHSAARSKGLASPCIVVVGDVLHGVAAASGQPLLQGGASTSTSPSIRTSAPIGLGDHRFERRHA